MIKIASPANSKRIDSLYRNISRYVHRAKSNVLWAVNTEQVKVYWLIGREIVEEEQAGKDRAQYGIFLLQEISSRLTKEFGRGFGISTLKDIRRFYCLYRKCPIGHAVRGQIKREGMGVRKTHMVRAKSQHIEFKSNLSWSHYRALMREDRLDARAFYETEASKKKWSSRELERQMVGLLFERLVKSKNKKRFMQLACKGQEIAKLADIVKDRAILEFLNISEDCKLVEPKLEEALIGNMQNFLLELGCGFSLVARQKRLILNGKHFCCDLVFYHYILKRFILIDLKDHELTHADLGQMQLYVNYFDMEEKAKVDGPTIGLILCSKQNKKMARYFFGDENRSIFASKYKLYLPSEKELEEKLKKEIKEIKYRYRPQK